MSFEKDGWKFKHAHIRHCFSSFRPERKNATRPAAYTLIFKPEETMELNIIHDEEDLRFYAVIEGDEAELTYTYPESGVMDFDHTFVPEGSRGKGHADKLVQSGLDYARSQNYQVIPSCPVVAAYIKRHPDYRELVQPE